jgi:hypothetical protein
MTMLKPLAKRSRRIDGMTKRLGLIGLGTSLTLIVGCAHVIEQECIEVPQGFVLAAHTYGDKDDEPPLPACVTLPPIIPGESESEEGGESDHGGDDGKDGGFEASAPGR